MHELSIALSLLDLATEEAARLQARVLAIHLKLGPLSGVVASALESAFDLARENTDLSDCQLVVEPVSVTVYCQHCGGNRPARSPQDLACSDCGAAGQELIGGRELEIVALEIEA